MYIYLRHNLLCYFLFLVLLIGGSGRADSYVWCLPVDGEPHLESLLDRHCGTDHRTAVTETAGVASFAAGDSGCGPCFDHAATGALLQSYQPLLHLPTPTVALLPVPCTSWSPREQKQLQTVLARQTFRPPPTLLALRTTILRC